MSIHFISGKPGGGKSLYATKLIFEELRFGTRHIVTNLALKVGELNAYYHENYDTDLGLVRYRVPWFLGWLWWFMPDWLAFRVTPIEWCQAETRIKQPKMDDICSRITIISDEQISNFFCYRPNCTIQSIPNDQWKKGVRPDYSVVNDGGVLFCLDEIHIAFNSRAWADTGAEVPYYLSQHRKLGDDVLAITQSVANVDKQFRSVAQDFTYIRNLVKESFGKFRLPARFVRKTYAQIATDKSEPMDTGFFSLDVKGIPRCYDTAKGVGIHGRAGADTKERKKGLHWAWFAIGAPIFIILILKFIPVVAVKFLNPASRSHPVKPGQTASVVSKAGVATNAVSGEPLAVNQAGSEPAVIDAKTNLLPVLTCCGYSVLFGRATAFLSDGRVVDSTTGLDAIGRDVVYYRGQILPIVARPLTNFAPPVVFSPEERVVQMPEYSRSGNSIQVYHMGSSQRANMAAELPRSAARPFNETAGSGNASGFNLSP